MNNASLISRYGEAVTVDGVATKAYFEDSKKSIYMQSSQSKSSALHTAFDVEVIHTVKEIGVNSVLVLKGQNFGVIETMPVYTHGKLSYVETVAFKDDFINDITIKQQSLHLKGVNLPNVSIATPITAKARIKTVKSYEHLQLALRVDKVPTHTIVLKYITGITVTDLIEWGARKFEVLSIENINEKNTLLIIDCIEVL